MHPKMARRTRSAAAAVLVLLVCATAVSAPAAAAAAAAGKGKGKVGSARAGPPSPCQDLARRAIARRELGAGGAAARRSTTCASGPPRRGASHARSSPAIRPPAPRTPARSDASAAPRLVRELLHLTFAFAMHPLFLLLSLLDLRFIRIVWSVLLCDSFVGLCTVKSDQNPIRAWQILSFFSKSFSFLKCNDLSFEILDQFFLRTISCEG
jgi:hypothetical protein